jgi:hypothetical protein
MVLSTGKPALAASVLPVGLFATRFGAGSALTFDSAITTVVGGVPPYTYLWTRVSGNTEVGPINGTSAATQFSAYFYGVGSYSTVYKCVVTDSAAASVDSNNITISMESN